MYSILRNRFGVPGVISVIALVFAMLGGAYAAGGDIGSKATSSAKSKKGPRGPKGPKGPKGDTGAVGPQGPAGANGKDGVNGKDGTNGKDGETGFTATLPVGATETGAWGGTGNNEEGFLGPLTFSIPLAAEITEAHIMGIKLGGAVPAECEDAGHAGTASAANPEADPGYLCVYVGFDPQENNNNPSVFKASETFIGGASTTGGLVFGAGQGPDVPYGGTFAVTGCGGVEFPCP